MADKQKAIRIFNLLKSRATSINEEWGAGGMEWDLPNSAVINRSTGKIIADHVEFNRAEFIAIASPKNILILIAEIERLLELCGERS